MTGENATGTPSNVLPRDWRTTRALFLLFVSAVLGGCSAPTEEPQRPSEPISKVEQEFSSVGVQRVIPLRIVQWKQYATDPDHLQLGWVQDAVQTANAIYRDAGVQFYVKSIESYASPIFYDVATPVVQYWPDVRGALMAVLPGMPDTAYLNSASAFDSHWLYIASSSSYASPEELIVWATRYGGEANSTFPWFGRGLIMTTPETFVGRTLAHELGHSLGLVHTFDSVSQPDPEPGGGTLGPDDSYDLIYGEGVPEAGPVLFASKASAAAYGGTKYSRNNWTNSENCSIATTEDCTVTCTLWLYNGQGFGFWPYQTGHPVIDGSIGFKLAGDNPPGTYKRGTNIMSYLDGLYCPYNGLTSSQVQFVRKYLKYDMIQAAGGNGTSYIGPPNHTYMDALGFRQANPAYKLDFDGDGKRDVGVFKPPSTVGGVGSFEILLSTSNWLSGGGLYRNFGTLGDIPVPADYDGDGRTDIAVYRTSGPNGTDPTNNNGYWVYCPSNNGLSNCTSPVTVSAGNREDVPIPGTNFDGYSATGEMAYYRPSTNTLYWRIMPYTTYQSVDFVNSPGAVMYAMQLDSDNKTDIVRYRPSSTSFVYRLSTDDWQTSVTRTFTGVARGSYPIRRTRAGKDILAIYDPTTSTFHTMLFPLTNALVTSCAYGNQGDTAIGTTFNFNPTIDQVSELLLLQKPNSVGDVVFRVRNSWSCSGDVAIQTIGAAALNRVVLFMGQDMSGDGQPDLMMLNTQTMEWRYYFSQYSPATWTYASANWGDSQDIPL